MRERTLGIGSVAVLGLACLIDASCGGSSATQPTPQSSCGTDSAPLAPGTSAGSLLVDGSCREYLVHLPPGHDASRPTPLVVAMHGYTGYPSEFESNSGLSRTADAEGFVVAYPAGIGRAWNLYPNGSDVRFLRALVEHLASRASLDRHRVYVTGFSMGGGMANRAACELADVFAAAAPVSGSFQAYTECSPQRPVPILAIHGAADTVIPPLGRPDSSWPAIGLWAMFWAQRNGCVPTPVVTTTGGVTETAWQQGCTGGSEVRLLVIDGLGHTWWPRANQEVWSFFESHVLPV